jgi:simple sugar transport system ATP-binding protein
MNQQIALEMKNVSKSFGTLMANKNVDLNVYRGEILAILGENGCGKTTLMNMIAGIYYPDSGTISVNGRDVVIRSPKDAFKYGIGMVHQHFKLVDLFTAAENIVLGVHEKGGYDIKKVNKRVSEIADRYGFNIDPKKKIYEMSVSEKQTVEILKVLYRGADILILDEPSAVLTPQETDKLFEVLRRMREDGKSILIITHKLNEVMSISDRVAVLRKGEHIATVNTSETNPTELTELMVGKKVSLNIERPDPKNVCDRLEIKNLSMTDADGVKVLDNITFTARSGEILGIAGIAGSGQKEILESIAGLCHPVTGQIVYHNPKNNKTEELLNKDPVAIREMGVRLSFVPEDRIGMGLVGNMDIVDNMLLRSYRKGHSVFVDRKKPGDLAKKIVSEL